MMISIRSAALCSTMICMVALFAGCSIIFPMKKSDTLFPLGAEYSIPLDATREVLNTVEPNADLDAVVKKVYDRTISELDASTLLTDMISISVIDLGDPLHPRIGAMKGDTPWYPASVVKMPFMVYAMDLIQKGEVIYDDELRDQMAKMIGPSSNVATQYVVDRITKTTGGESLEGPALEEWLRARYRPYNYFTSLDLDELFVLQKTWDSLPTGRDMDLLGKKVEYHYELSNKMTTNDTARLLYLIDRRAIVSPGACDHMLDLMAREPGEINLETGRYFVIRHGVPPGSKVWAKDGSTDFQRHDAGIVELPGGRKFVLVVFTHYRQNATHFISLYTRNLIEELN